MMKPETKHTTKTQIIRWMTAVICTLALLLACVPLLTVSVSAHIPVYGKTLAAVNLRTGKGTQYSVITVMKRNTTFMMSDRSDPHWYRIRLGDGTVGYCYSAYIDILNDCQTTDYVNFRTEASTNASIIKTLNKGTRLDILSFSGKSWIKAKTADGTEGYVCSDYVDYIENPDIVADSSVQTSGMFSLSKKSLVLIVGKKETLTTAGVLGTVTWKTSNGNVAEVTSQGVVSAKKAGTAVITATDTKRNKSLSCTVSVVKTDYDKLTLSTSSKTLNAGSSFTLTVKTVPAGGKYTLKSSDTSIATVTQAGVVKGLKGGTAVITASDSSGAVTASCKVTVRPKGTISLSDTSLSVNAGSSVRIGITKTPSNLSVKWTSSNNSVAGVSNGLVSGLRPGTAVITASDEAGSVKAKCTVTVHSVSSGYVTLSRYKATTTAGKTIYIKGYNGGYWTSSDPAVAKVWDGFIETKKAGRAAICYNDYYGNKAICVVTVTDAAPIKFCYSSPNSATMGSKVKLIAITDRQRTGVYFTVKDGANPTSVMGVRKAIEGNTIVWQGTYTPKEAGTFKVKAYAKLGDEWETCSDGVSDVYITDKLNPKETALERLRASDEVIHFIGDKEGFVSGITYDTLAGNLPTLGHGYVVWEGQCFYDNLTKSEGYALLVKAVNEESYTKRVNDMLIGNNIYFNQQQFDALVSFSYNLGTGWTYGSDLKTILLNSWGQVTVNDSTMTGRVTSSDGLNLRSEATTSSSVIKVLNYNEAVTLVSTTRYNGIWYKVKTSDGKTGYCSSTYLNVSATGGSTYIARNLNNVNRNALITEMLSYHHAGGECYYGLLYRRADELEMFLYNDYAPDGRSNYHNFPNPPCISW